MTSQAQKPDYPKAIAIDGPAASGKTTVGTRIAQALDYMCLDTGVMYRAVAWLALEKGVAPDDEEGLTQLAEQIDIDVRAGTVADGRAFDVLINGEDHTWDIRKPEVNASVSEVSVFPGVREAMTLQQRKIAERGRIVMLGRDIGTVVLPDADLKIYLDASVEVRAQRRCAEEWARGRELSLEETLVSLKHRDEIDSTRTLAPLTVADDAVLINTDTLTIDEVIAKIMAIISERAEKKG